MPKKKKNKESNLINFINMAFYEPASYFSLFILMTTLIIIRTEKDKAKPHPVIKMIRNKKVGIY